MKALILTIGDELLIGQVVNSNAAVISDMLNGAGVEVVRHLTVGDDPEEIGRALRQGFEECDAVLITGGLGPTHDDITKKSLCTFFQSDLVSDAAVRACIERFLAQRSQPWSDASEEQTLVPCGAGVILNHHGTAPGILFERGGKYVFAMPGVPYEMEYMMRDFVVPFLLPRSGGKTIVHRTLRTTGIAESVLAARLGNIEEMLSGARLAFLPAPGGVRLRISVVDAERSRAEARVDAVERRIRAKAEEFIYGTGDEEIEGVVGRLLAERNLTIAIAESCTGGLVSHRLTNVPGSSRYLLAAVVAYSNASKRTILGVPEELLRTRGAVSEEVAIAMATGARAVSGASVGLSTTGIAGPSGGTPEKPVGLVWIGYADAQRSFARRFTMGGERVRIKERASQSALDLVRRTLLELP